MNIPAVSVEVTFHSSNNVCIISCDQFTHTHINAYTRQLIAIATANTMIISS